MTVILYIETNFLMSFASGRDRATNSLIDPPPFVRLTLPAACFMEACSTLERLKKNHEKFVRDYRNQVGEYQRNVVWPHEDSRLNVLLESVQEIERYFSRFQSQLLLVFQSLGMVAERIELSTDVLSKALANKIIEDATDNLILLSILEHARSHPAREKAFLTENHKDFHDNPEAQKALKDAGIRYFRKARTCLNWLNSLRPQPDPELPPAPRG